MKYLIILVTLLLFSCNNKEKIDKNINLNVDSLSYGLKNIDSLNEKQVDILFANSKFDKNTLKKRNFVSKIATKYYYLRNLEKFKNSSKLLFNLSIEANDSLNLANSYRFLAGYYKDTKVYDSSFYFYLKAEKEYKLSNDVENYAIILLYKSIVQYNISDFVSADITARNSYQILKTKKRFDKTFAVLNNLGLISTELKEYDNAISYHKKALDIVNQNKLNFSYDQKSVCFNNIGYLYLKKGEYYKAISNFKLGLKQTNLKVNDPELYALLLDNIAYSNLKLKKYKNISNLLNESLKIRDSLNNVSEIINSNIHLSEYYSAIQNQTKSIYYSKKALELSKKSKNPFDLIISLKQAAAVDVKNASVYTDDYIRISDSLQIVERNSKDRFARIALETDELRKEKDSLIEQNRDILNYFMGTMAFVGVLFFMRTQRSRRRELAFTQAQQRANEELYKLIISQQSKLEEGKFYEKNRIAKELHDGVLGRMFGLRLNLDGLNKRTDEEAVEERLRYLDELKIIEQDLREISHELSREKFELINNFVAIVNGLLEEQTTVNPAKLTAIIGENIDWDNLSNTTKINLYRILQESLQNINKYANAKFIKVEFKKDKKGNLILNIADDGDGYDSQIKSNGIGIKNMVNRTHESNGTIEIKSEKNKGTQVFVLVPLDNKIIKL